MRKRILERYCRESVRPSVRGKSWMHSPDRVLESPRLLSFPYHNDSHFLPTAEQLQYNIIHHGSVHSSSSQTETASLLSSLPVSSRHRSSLQKNSAFSSTPDRRSLPNRVIPHSLHSRASHHRPSSMRTISASTLHSHASSIHKEKDKKHWLKRILKFLGKNKKPSCEKNQVWFRQYSKNPSFNHPPPIMT
ncbi:hypothetical protein BY458DRAFT_539648 [Sporodiniella umbellata]|nr:hypothetical protein BY458DRAFT_539648 [Sporodiniella umbellata]